MHLYWLYQFRIYGLLQLTNSQHGRYKLTRSPEGVDTRYPVQAQHQLDSNDHEGEKWGYKESSYSGAMVRAECRCRCEPTLLGDGHVELCGQEDLRADMLLPVVSHLRCSFEIPPFSSVCATLQ